MKLSQEIKYIFTGYFNLLYHIISRKKSYNAAKRFIICHHCPYRKKILCGKCGCLIIAKIFTEFPINKKDNKSIGGCPLNPPKW